MNILRSALSLVIYKNGDVAEKDVDELIQRYAANKGITLDKEKYLAAVSQASAAYKQQTPCLYMCTETRCLDVAYLSPTGRSLDQLSEELGCQVKPTGCHYQCDYSPVLTLKTQSEATHFQDCSSQEKWTAYKAEIIERVKQQSS